jgi:hypothetical protein
MRRVYTLHTLKGYLARRDVPCPSCGYNLRGLRTGACPECGFGFDVESLKVLRTPRPLILEWTIDHASWAVAMLACLNYGLALVALPRPEVRLVKLASLALLALLALGHLYSALRLDERGFAWADRAVKVAGLLAACESLLVLRLLIF